MDEPRLVVTSEANLARVVEEALRRVLEDRPTPDRLLTSRETAEILGVSPRSIPALVERDGLPALRIGRALRFKLSALETWCAERALRPGAHASKHLARLKRIRAAG